MPARFGLTRSAIIVAAASIAGLAVALTPAIASPARAGHHDSAGGLPVRPGAIGHVIVIEMENESFGDTFGPASPATYLNDTLVPQGELLPGYYATGHVSLDNYIAQISGQAPNLVTSSDCVTSITALTR